MSGLPECETLELRREGLALHVTLNRPAVRNAMSVQMVEELSATFDAAASSDVRALVLRGAGGHFCAGGDVRDMARALAASAGEVDPVETMNRRFGEVLVRGQHLPLALIAVVEGSVMGGGLGLACVADLVLASPSVKFRLPETSLGLIPAQIAPFVAARLGLARARRLAVLGGSLDAASGLELGLCDEVSENLEASLAAALAKIRRCAPEALAKTKALVLDVGQVPLETLLDRGAREFAQAVRGAEGQAGTAAFISKSAPPWAEDDAHA